MSYEAVLSTAFVGLELRDDPIDVEESSLLLGAALPVEVVTVVDSLTVVAF